MVEGEGSGRGMEWDTCPTCGMTFQRNPTGRRMRYCGSACRQRAFRQRQAAGRLDDRAATAYTLASDLFVEVGYSLTVATPEQLDAVVERVRSKSQHLVQAITDIAAARRAVTAIESTTVNYRGEELSPTEIVNRIADGAASRTAFAYLSGQQDLDSTTPLDEPDGFEEWLRAPAPPPTE